MKRPPATLAELRDAIEALRDDLGELGGELLHRSDADRERLETIASKVDDLHSDRPHGRKVRK